MGGVEHFIMQSCSQVAQDSMLNCVTFLLKQLKRKSVPALEGWRTSEQERGV